MLAGIKTKPKERQSRYDVRRSKSDSTRSARGSSCAIGRRTGNRRFCSVRIRGCGRQSCRWLYHRVVGLPEHFHYYLEGTLYAVPLLYLPLYRFFLLRPSFLLALIALCRCCLFSPERYLKHLFPLYTAIRTLMYLFYRSRAVILSTTKRTYPQV